MLAAEAYAAKKEHQAALVIYDLVARNARGMPKVLATEGCGKAFEALKRNDEACQAYQFALQYMRATLQEYERDAELRERLRFAWKRLARSRDVGLYGAAFVLYREAERLRHARKEYAAALAKYRAVEGRFPGTVWSEASRIYSGYCLLELGEQEAARELWTRFYRENRRGLYRGEALLALGCLALNEFLDIRRAQAYFRELCRWTDEVGRDDACRTPEVEARAREVSVPAEAMVERNAFGFLCPVQVRPGELRNRRTCPWYLRWLRKGAVLGSGFRYVLTRDAEGGRKHFQVLRDLDDLTGYLEAHDGPNTMTRLVGASETGLINCDEYEMVGLSPRGRVAALLGDYWVAALERGMARRVYRNLAEDRYGRPNVCDRAYGVLGLGRCDYVDEIDAVAAKHLAKFEDEFVRTPLAAHGLFTLGQSLYMPFNYAKEKDQELRRKWEAAFSKAVRVGGRTFWGEYARLRLGMIYALSANHRDHGRRILAVVQAHCKDSRCRSTRSLAELAGSLMEISLAGKTVYPIE